MSPLRLCCLAMLVATVGCANSGTSTAQAASAGGRGGGSGTAPVPVSTTVVVTRSVPITISTIGTAEASATVEVRPQISGQLMTVDFGEGQEVKEGQLLFSIDSRPFDVALKQAEAAFARDSAQADNAARIANRADDLLKQHIIAQADHDSQVSQARALAETANADQAAVDAAKLNLQYTKIVAPISGRTGPLAVHPGSLVRTTDTSPLLVINQLTPIRVGFSVPGQYLDRIREGQSAVPLRAEAHSPGGDAAPSTGDVFFIDNVIDQSTSTIRLKALFANTDRRLWPGELLDINLRLAVESHAIVVPAAAVQNGQQGTFVFVVNADRSVAMRPVTIARTVVDDAVVSSGLKPGEEVVTDGQLRLTPGVKVSIKPPVVHKSGP